MRHNENEKDWVAYIYWALIPSAITYEPKINSRTIKEERTRARSQQESGTVNGGADIVGEAQGGSGRTVNGEAILLGRLGQVEVPAESRSDVSPHGFWKWGTTVMFDIRIFNFDVGSYLRMTPEKALAKLEKESKNLYLQAFLERRQTFTPMVYSADGIPGAETLAVQKKLSALLSYKLKREYS